MFGHEAERYAWKAAAIKATTEGSTDISQGENSREEPMFDLIF
jgi:hypothetical protein